MSKKYHYSTGIIAALIAAVIALQNTETVQVNFLFWKFEILRIILIVLMLVIGFLLGYVFHSIKHK